MSQPRICPNCRSAVPGDAPAGVCPACALRAGFDSGGGPDSQARTTPAQGAQPLSVELLASRIPELEQFELIGQGGMGVVYRARHRNLDRLVAVKVLDSGLRDNSAFAERFAREARTMAQLDHPNIVSVYDFGHRDDLYYLIMELVDGVNLRQAMEAGDLKPQEALAMVPHICEALQYAHDQGVVHRDIKPENILIDRNGSIKIADFGLAKLAGGKGGRRLTLTNQIMGTPNYMAPEQIEHPGEVDHRADIFALGVVFYELLTGELPVGRFPPPSKKVQVDVRLDEVVLRTLEKEPDLRYQQASELGSAVEAIATGEDLAADLPKQSRSRPRRRQQYEYRSAKKVFGVPLIHIAFSRDPAGKQMSVAIGIIAIGDVAIGGVAIGAFTCGGIALGGISVGLVSFGGVVLGLLTAMGGIAVGGFAVGGLAAGMVAAHGALDFAYLALAETALFRVTLAGWLIETVGFTAGIMAAAYAWVKAAGGRPSHGT